MKIWTVSEDNAGTLTQSIGVAERLGGSIEVVRLSRRPLWRRIKSLHFDPLMLDEPDAIVSCGVLAEPVVTRVKQRYGGRPLAIHLQPPGATYDRYDLVFASSHDWLPAYDREPRFRRVLGVAHRIVKGELEGIRAAARAELGVEASRVVTILVGGPNGAYAMGEVTAQTIASACRLHLAQGWTVLISTSRRTPPAIAAAVSAISDPNLYSWTGHGENPYRRYLAAADAFVVTADSISMLCEVTATGRPVHRLDLRPDDVQRAAKFDRFHADMTAAGFVRSYSGELEQWTYEVPDEAGRIAGLIRAELARRSSDRQ